MAYFYSVKCAIKRNGELCFRSPFSSHFRFLQYWLTFMTTTCIVDISVLNSKLWRLKLYSWCILKVNLIGHFETCPTPISHPSGALKYSHQDLPPLLGAVAVDWDRNSEENKSSKVIYFVLRKTKRLKLQNYIGESLLKCAVLIVLTLQLPNTKRNIKQRKKKTYLNGLLTYFYWTIALYVCHNFCNQHRKIHP